MAKSHNDVVRGWRNYYSGNSSEMDRQLADLDAWRSHECAAYLQRGGNDPAAAVVWFERIVDQSDAQAPAGAYTTPIEAGEAHLDLPPERVDEWHQRATESGAQRDGRVFSTVRQVRDAEVGRKQLPVILEDGWLRVPTFGGFVTKSQALVVVRRKKQVIFECPFDDVSCLTVEADGIALSTSVIDECARRGIAVAVCRISGTPVARLVPARSPLDASVVHQQLRARVGKSGTALVQAVLAAKLANQRALLLYHSKYQGRDANVRKKLIDGAKAIAGYMREIDRLAGMPMRKARRPLFLAEALAAAHYWEAFCVLVPANLGFRRRVHRGAEDVVNKALNYGYAHLLGRVWVAVRRAGLEPSLGLLHTGRRRSAGLVFDLMEPFRQPVVDRTVLGLLGRGAHLQINESGDLTLRTRALLQRALARRLAPAAGDPSQNLLLHIQRRTIAFRRRSWGTSRMSRTA